MPSKIEWTDETWNPLTGCSKISDGCKNCYAERMARRLAGRYGYPKDDPFRVTFHPDRLDQPRKWRKPRRVFVCSMGDLWHKDSDWIYIDDVFFACHHHNAEHHIYLFLTKRIEAAWYYFNSPIYSKPSLSRKEFLKHKNIWLGVTAENQETADKRIPILLEIPAAVRFISIEPMLGPVDLEIVPCKACNHPGNILAWPCPYCEMRRFEWPDWVICGGESGPGARPMHPAWVRSLRDQCIGADVPFFFKQWGEFRANQQPVDIWNHKTGDFETLEPECGFKKVGKKTAGRELDGQTWEQYPT